MHERQVLDKLLRTVACPARAHIIVALDIAVLLHIDHHCIRVRLPCRLVAVHENRSRGCELFVGRLEKGE